MRHSRDTVSLSRQERTGANLPQTADSYDVAVVGGGSGGIGAALAAARLGRRVLLIEKADRLGGTATRGGVHCWEAGAGGTGIPFDIYKRLKRIVHAVGIYSYGRHILWQPPAETPRFPGGETLIDGQRHYIDSLRRHGIPGMTTEELHSFVRTGCHGVTFEPNACAKIVEEMLAETGTCAVLKGTAVRAVKTDNRRISSIELDTGKSVQARVCIDSTADAFLAVASGCQTMLGQEARDTFGEPSAPEQTNLHLNGVTLIYRVSPTKRPRIEPLPPAIPADCWWSQQFPLAQYNHYPCGDVNVNMVPTMEGQEALTLGNDAAYEECRRRVLAHWHHSQSAFPEFQSYRLAWIAPALGIRETRRVVGRYVLTEHDLRSHLSGQLHDDVIALADHSMDTHGTTAGRSGTRDLGGVYGIPYRCLVARDVDNLLVACRAASFSSLAASSCRLSRTMMQLGQAAGTAAALALQLGVDLADVPSDYLQAHLRQQHVQLDWPMPEYLVAYVSNEDL